MLDKRSLLLLLVLFSLAACNRAPKVNLNEIFTNPPEEAKPWVFWYWIKAGVSKEGITADLEAMHENGIGGAYLIPVQGAENPPLYEPAMEQLTPEWYEMVKHAFKESKRLGLKIAMHSCDGFAVAGGPWITPKMSMQKVVWSEIAVSGAKTFSDTLPQPEMERDYYEDIAVFAYPVLKEQYFSSKDKKPKVTSDMTSDDLSFLTNHDNSKEFKSATEGWIQYEFDKPVTCRLVEINTRRLNYPSNRLIIKTSNDGITFDSVCRLEPARHGWQDYEHDYAHSIPATTAKYFRFIYSKQGAEPGSEDLDAARWSTRLKIQGIHLSEKPVIHQIAAKNGSMWRIAKKSNNTILPDSLCIPFTSIVNLTSKLDSNGVLSWEMPEGQWRILRIGHTSTGHTNYIGGKGLGLECDKFNSEVVQFQFDQWFGKIYNKVGIELSKEVLKVFHVDSWECGSQNWSPVFAGEFEKRRGYNLIPYLPIMAGLPINDAEFSEKVLYDVRKTIDELITENFFGTMNQKAKALGCQFSSESVAPVMVSDAMTHYKNVDIPMGEFWFNSPTHDKPADVLDAISAAHIYGKNIVQSEAFTTLRMDWDENPAKLKTLGDRNFSYGVNRLVFHVFAHNPWVDTMPGMTLNTVGLYFQRDQTWWKHSKAWMQYLHSSQALLQQGKPVVDVAVFTGNDYPRRALTPDRLVNILPGLFGDAVVERERIRLENKGVPVKERPYSINSSANTFDPANWIDPLQGYHYDSFNQDALLNMAFVKDGKIMLPNGQVYSILVIPGSRKGSPNWFMNTQTVNKIIELVKAGATVVVENIDTANVGKDTKESKAINELFNANFTVDKNNCMVKNLGKGKLILAPYTNRSFENIGIEKDLMASCNSKAITDIAWTHRKGNNFDIYFVSNQIEVERKIDFSFRVSGKQPEIFNPTTGEINDALNFNFVGGRTELSLDMSPNESLFVVFENIVEIPADAGTNRRKLVLLNTIDAGWKVTFQKKYMGISDTLELDALADWTTFSNDSIKYYSGIASYYNTFENSDTAERIWLDLGKVNHTAEIFVNGKSCGMVWTYPYRVEITQAVCPGINNLEIQVANSWKNRIIGDNTLENIVPLTFTTAPFRIKGQPLSEAGIVGPVCVLINNLTHE